MSTDRTILGVDKENKNPPTMYDGYTTPGTYWLSSDLIEVIQNPDTLRIIQRVTQSTSAGLSGPCWFRVRVGNTWSNPRYLTVCNN